MPSRNDEYRPGNPEYDYWNDKNLYPSLQHKEDYSRSQQSSSLSDSDSKVGLGSVFLTIFMWLLIFAPFALFFTWKDWIIQVIFWGGIAIVILVFLLWLHSAVKEERQKNK